MPPLAVDVALAVLTVVLLIVSVVVAHDRGAPAPGLSTYLSVSAIAAPLPFRRRYPLVVLLACATLLFVFYSLNNDAGLAPAVPLAVALYTAAEYGHLRWSLLVSLFYTAVGTYVLIGLRHQPVLTVLADFVQEGSLLLAICLLGEAVRNRRGWAGEVRDRLRQAAEAAEAEHEREAARRVTEERVRIARELHDVLAHTISALTIQARVILDGLPDGPPQVRSAGEAILSTSREAMSEVRATVGLLRVADEQTGVPPGPVPGVGQLDGLLATARATGLVTRRETVGSPVPLPATVDLSVYRIVQESLTNVVRHARAATVTVTLRYLPGAVEVQVDDDGRGPAAAGRTGGYGLVGIRERAGALGGAATTGPGPGGGFRVLARLRLGTAPAPVSPIGS
jgi:signal transduction histidine kinase